MMSLLNTKPRWAPTAIATDRGWCHPNTGEVFVAIGNLKAKIEAEQAKLAPVVEIAHEPIIVPEVITVKEEIVMSEEPKVVVEDKPKRAYNKKPKVIGEVVEQPKMKIIGEVVEYDLDTDIIGE